MAAALSESVGREPSDPDANFAAGLLLATWAVAFLQAHKMFGQTHDPARAKEAFLAIIDKGARGLSAALAGAPYA